jgi:hypothetical protein
METENDVRVKVSAGDPGSRGGQRALILKTVVIHAATWLIVSEVPPFVHGPVEEDVDLVPPDEADAAPVFLELSPADAFDVPAAPGSPVCRVNAGVEPSRVSRRLSASADRMPTVMECS